MNSSHFIVRLLLIIGLALPSYTVGAIAYSTTAEARVVGKTRGLHPRLRKRLARMSRHFGRTIQITSGCRTSRGNRGFRNSYHLTRRGCRAADVVIKGVSKRSILAYWARTGGGGRGYYCGKSIVHVDVGPSRTWTWHCRKRRSKKRRG